MPGAELTIEALHMNLVLFFRLPESPFHIEEILLKQEADVHWL